MAVAVQRSVWAVEMLVLASLAACGGSGNGDEAPALQQGRAVSAAVQGPDATQAAAAAIPDAVTVVPLQGGVDDIAPSAPHGVSASATADGRVALSWLPASDNVGVASYHVWRDGQPLHSVNGSTTAYTDSALASATTYVYRVSAADAAGNSSPQSVEYSVTTAKAVPEGENEVPAAQGGERIAATTSVRTVQAALVPREPDTSSPTNPPNLVAHSRTESSLVLQWRESTDNVGVVGYDVFKNAVWVGGTSGREFSFRNLAPASRYEFSVRAYDAAGNRSAATTVTTATLGGASPVDIVAPTIPAGVTTGAVTSSSVVVQWKASSDATGVAGYELYQNGISTGEVTRQTSYTYGDLAAGTAYSFAVKAFDAAGNKSAASAPISVRTTPATVLTARWIAGGVVIEGRNPWNENPMMFWDDVATAFAASGLPDGAEVPAGADKLYGASSTVVASRFKYQRTSETRSGEAGVVYAATGHKPVLSYPNYNGPARTFNKMYVSWWYKPSVSPGAEGASNKFIRLWDNGNGYGTRISWTQMHMTCAVPADYKPEVSWGNWWDKGGVAGRWNRHEVEVDLSVPHVRTWVNGVAGHNHPCVKSADYANSPIRIGLIGFDHGGYADNTHGYDTMKTAMDDIYIANSPARVELSDSPTWSTASNREVLPVKSWAPNRIELGQVRGVLKGAAKLYVYVVAPDGSVNANGMALSCGSGTACL